MATTDLLGLTELVVGDSGAGSLVAPVNEAMEVFDAAADGLIRAVTGNTQDGIINGLAVSDEGLLHIHVVAGKFISDSIYCVNTGAVGMDMTDDTTNYIYAIADASPNKEKTCTFDKNASGTPPARGIEIARVVTAGGDITSVDNNSAGRPKMISGYETQLAVEPAANLTAEGLTTVMIVDTNAQGFGAPLFLAADGHLDTADADATTTAPCVALALEAGTGRRKVLLLGIIRNDAWTWITGPGLVGIIYLGTNVGTLTQTAPSGPDDVIQPVGFATSDDTMYFNPMTLFLTHV